MTDRYVIEAVLAHIEGLEREGTLTARPVRLDGFTRQEVGDLVAALTAAHPGSIVHALSPYNNEPAHEINAERATRYRNLVDAAKYRNGFLLLVPLGQVVESSLDEPAFLVIPRAAHSSVGPYRSFATSSSSRSPISRRSGSLRDIASPSRSLGSFLLGMSYRAPIQPLPVTHSSACSRTRSWPAPGVTSSGGSSSTGRLRTSFVAPGPPRVEPWMTSSRK